MLKKIAAVLKFVLEVALLGIFALMLFSYDAMDPSLNVSSSSDLVHNYFGRLGSYSADAFMQTFGVASWLFIIFAFVHILFKALRQPISLLWLKRIVCVLLVLLLCFLCAPVDLGGVVGSIIYRFLPAAPFWCLPLLWILFFVGLVYAVNVPVKKVALWIWYFARVLFNKMMRYKTDKVVPVQKPVIQKKEKVKPVERKKAKAPVVTPVRKKQSDGFILPSVDLLDEPKVQSKENLTREMMDNTSRRLESILAQFGVRGEVVRVSPGPVVTLYEFEPAAGVKTARVIGLAEDMARAMSVVAVRMAVIPGSSVIGIEIPNKVRQTVYIKEIINTSAFTDNTGALPLILGKNISGNPFLADLAKSRICWLQVLPVPVNQSVLTPLSYLCFIALRPVNAA